MLTPTRYSVIATRRSPATPARLLTTPAGAELGDLTTPQLHLLERIWNPGWSWFAHNKKAATDLLSAVIAGEQILLAAPAPRLVVDIDRGELVLDGTRHDVESAQALRWVAVLAQRPGVWTSARELENTDGELRGVRTDRLRGFLPEVVLRLIESQTGRGSRIRL